MNTNPLLTTFATQFLLLPADIQVEEVVIDNNRLLLVLSSTQMTAACPYCSCRSARVHSHYTRTLVDLPCQERTVVLRVQVRRFFCSAAECARKTFAEQFPALAPTYARRTHRQFQRLCQMAFALGGRPAARLLKQEAMPTSFSTVLRLLRHCPAPGFPPPHVLGIDDFALKKGDRYGTLLVDLERHRPIDVLPDRDAATVITWLKAHPEIEIVSRDRASAYAQVRIVDEIRRFGRYVSPRLTLNIRLVNPRFRRYVSPHCRKRKVYPAAIRPEVCILLSSKCRLDMDQ